MVEQGESNLRKTLRALVPTVEQHRYQQITVEETKQWLIAPLLTALGWNTHDPAEVRYEYRANHQCNPVDYALMVQGQTTLVIEAKGLGKDLTTGIAQLFGNLGVAGGVHWGVLTDGDKYRVYRVTADGGASEKLLFEVSVSADVETAFKKLSFLSRSNMMIEAPSLIDIEWQNHVIGGHAKSALRAMLDGSDRSLIDGIYRRHPEHPASAVIAYLATLEIKDRGGATGGESDGGSIRPAAQAEERSSDISDTPEKSKPRRAKGYEVFAELLQRPIKREDFIAAFIKEGFSPETATSYITWAKRVVEPLPGKVNGQEIFNNPFFFEIESYKDHAGVVWLRKRQGRDFAHEDGDAPFKDWVGR